MVERRRGRKSAEPLVVHVVTERQAVGSLSVRVSGLHRGARLLMVVRMRMEMRRCRRLVYGLVLRHGAQHFVVEPGCRRRRRQSVDIQRVGGGGRHISTSGWRACNETWSVDEKIKTNSQSDLLMRRPADNRLVVSVTTSCRCRLAPPAAPTRPIGRRPGPIDSSAAGVSRPARTWRRQMSLADDDDDKRRRSDIAVSQTSALSK